jgi:hypothetical protein
MCGFGFRAGELLDELDIDCVSLHSQKSQAKRMAALGRARE